jgi:hypothetical protein
MLLIYAASEINVNSGLYVDPQKARYEVDGVRSAIDRSDSFRPLVSLADTPTFVKNDKNCHYSCYLGQLQKLRAGIRVCWVIRRTIAPTRDDGLDYVADVVVHVGAPTTLRREAPLRRKSQS